MKFNRPRAGSVISCVLAVMASKPSYGIFGGDKVVNRVSPQEKSVVALQLNYVDEAGSRSFKKASAVAIGRQVILTAGHNLYYMSHATDVEVVFAPQPCWGQNNCGETRIRGRKIVVHPHFQNSYPSPPINDIALLYLETKLPESIELADPSSRRTLIGSGKHLVLGYGLSEVTTEYPPLSDFRLRKVSLTPLSADYELGSEEFFLVDQSKRGFCGGDSGGPVFFPNSSEVIGLASHTGKNASGQWSCVSSGTFVDVAHYFSWISQVLHENAR